MKHLYRVALAVSLLLSVQVQAASPNSQECDGYSQLAHEYYLNHSSSAVGEIGRASLKVYPGDSVLSRLTLHSRKGDLLQSPRKYSVQTSAFPPPLSNRFRDDDYIMILIPPGISGDYFGQLKAIDDEGLNFSGLPSLLAVHSDAFFHGRCRSGNTPALIANQAAADNHGIAHVLLPESQLKALVAALFLDHDSYDIDKLIQYYDANKFVDEKTWGGWVRLDLDHRRRTPLHWLFGSKLGKAANLYGVGETHITYRLPSATEIAEEIEEIRHAWRSRLTAFRDAVSQTKEDIAAVKSILQQSEVDVDLYLDLTRKISSSLQAHRQLVEEHRQEMETQQDYFMTDTEIDFLAGVMRDHIASLSQQFNALSRLYQDMVFRSGSNIDERVFMAPAPVDVNGQVVPPLPSRKLNLPVSQLGGSLPAAYVGYLSVGERPNTFTVNINGLVDLDRAVNSMSGKLRSEAYAIQSCSKRITFVNTDIEGGITDGEYIKPVDVGVQIRSCVTFDYYWPCGKWYKPKICKKRKTASTNLYKTTAHGKVNFSITRAGEDVIANYGYRICAHGIICASGGDELPSVMTMMRTSTEIQRLIEEQGLSIARIGLRKARHSGQDLLAVQIQTGDLPASRALMLLELLRGVE